MGHPIRSSLSAILGYFPALGQDECIDAQAIKCQTDIAIVKNGPMRLPGGKSVSYKVRQPCNRIELRGLL